MSRTTKKKMRRAWGYLLLAVLIYAWLGLTFDPALIEIVSGVVVLYSLFLAPVWCCAETRDLTFCRNNSYGILMGCHFKQHKWQKLTMAINHHQWGRLVRRVFANIAGRAAAFSACAGMFSALIALSTFMFK